MGTETARDYHMRRAQDELDLAYRAEGFAAMNAHFRLSALHMARLVARPSAPTPAGSSREACRHEQLVTA